MERAFKDLFWHKIEGLQSGLEASKIFSFFGPKEGPKLQFGGSNHEDNIWGKTVVSGQFWEKFIFEGFIKHSNSEESSMKFVEDLFKFPNDIIHIHMSSFRCPIMSIITYFQTSISSMTYLGKIKITRVLGVQWW